MAPMPLTGTIGATVTGNADPLQSASNRRALPDQVTSFFLPTVDRPTEQKQQRGRKSNAARQEGAAQGEKEVDEDVMDIGSSMILLQSLRQSRLTHLTSMLPYLSTRHRTSTKYHPPPAGFPFPAGLDPVASPPTLLHLGRADVRVGPFVFPRTRFGEARVEGGLQDAEGAALLKTPAGPSTPSKPAADKPTSKPQQGPDNAANAASATKSAPASSTAASPPPAISPSPKSLAVTPTDPSTLTPKAPALTTTSTTTMPASKPTTADSSAQSTPSSAKPPTTPAPGQAPINGKVVKAVSAAAQRDPELQKLLHAAANGKATPEQLRELAAFIAKVSEQLEKLEKAQEQQKQKDTLATKTNGSTTVPLAKTAVKGTKKKVAAAGEGSERSPKAKTGKGNAAEVGAGPQRAIPAPSHAIVPPYPPIITVEFRENPSARFILPLWRDAVVERRCDAGERTIKVTMLLPAVGSSAALRAAGDTGAPATPTKPSKTAAKKAAGAAAATYAESIVPEETFSPMKPPSTEQLKKPAPTGAETRAVTWGIGGAPDSPLSDGIWQLFGRVEGAKTWVDGVEVKETEGTLNGQATEVHSATAGKPVSEQTLMSLITKLRALPPEAHDTQRMPKLRVRPDEVPRDLADHLTDKFAARMQTLGARPIVRIKRGGGGGEEEEHFEVLRSVEVDVKGKRARLQGNDEDGDESLAVDGDETMMSNGGPSKPKRRRHVAKYNLDGTLKLCQACGTNSTPMWRRGPAGKSTLCNACGAKWKVGRLVVPDQPPTMPPASETSESGRRKKAGKKKANVQSNPTGSSAEQDVEMQEASQSSSTALPAVAADRDSEKLGASVEAVTEQPLAEKAHDEQNGPVIATSGAPSS